MVLVHLNLSPWIWQKSCCRRMIQQLKQPPYTHISTIHSAFTHAAIITFNILIHLKRAIRSEVHLLACLSKRCLNIIGLPHGCLATSTIEPTNTSSLGNFSMKCSPLWDTPPNYEQSHVT